MKKIITRVISNSIYFTVNGIMFWIACSGDPKLENVPIVVYSVILVLSAVVLACTCLMFICNADSNTKHSKLVAKSFFSIKKSGLGMALSLAKSLISLCLMFAIGFAAIPALYILATIASVWLNQSMRKWLDEHKEFMAGKEYEADENA